MKTNKNILEFIDMGYMKLYDAHTWRTGSFLEKFYFEIINYNNQYYLYLNIILSFDDKSHTVKGYGAQGSFSCAIDKTNEILKSMCNELKFLIETK